ncbi:hypothetical protein GIR22_16865 [Pseudomonas sp. CCM 7891]|uniref:Uncharacterized protein n=1 Tax=Pseudomonas karstica TaxID=1055468 RepID=A0A7X2UYG8_9PSED|nr:hypothetical protein [Pseudomonas karstica]MTD20801.1 hypothetical protein [Pseudomonas karstica]
MLAKVVNDNVRSLDKRSALESIVALPDDRNPHISQRKTSNLRAHLVQSQPL